MVFSGDFPHVTARSFSDRNNHQPSRKIQKRVKMKIKFMSVLAGTFAKSSAIAAIAAATIAVTPVVVKAQTVPITELFPILSGVELTVQQKIQLVELGSQTQTEFEKIVTPEQRSQFQKALAEGKGFVEALGAMNISSEQQTQLQEVFRSTQTQLVSTFTPTQRQKILENVRSILQLPPTQ
jgi:hypothetical protein